MSDELAAEYLRLAEQNIALVAALHKAEQTLAGGFHTETLKVVRAALAAASTDKE